MPNNYYGTTEYKPFEKIYRTNGHEVIKSIMELPDGSYAFTGTTAPVANTDEDVYYGRADANGELIWSQAINGASDEGGNDIIETPDHNILIAGYTRSFNNLNQYEVFLIKTDLDGHVIWKKTISDGTSALKIMLSKDNDGYIITGGASVFAVSIGLIVYVAKVSFDGDLIWSQKYTGAKNEIGQSMCYDDNGNIIVISSPFFEFSTNDAWVLKLDSLGNSLWTQTFADNGYEKAGNIINTGNDFLFNSSSGTLLNPAGIARLSKIDSSGNIIFQKSLPSSFPYSSNWMITTTDNNLLLTGSKTDSAGHSPAYLMKTDNAGNILWTKTFGDTLNYTANRIIETADSYVLAGAKTDSAGLSDALIIKVKK